MSRDRSVRGAAIAIGLFLAALAILGGLVADGPLGVDETVAAALTLVTPSAITGAFNTLASLPIVILVGGLAAIDRFTKDHLPLAAAFVFGLLGEIPTTIAKSIVDRPRPPGSAEIEAIGSVASYPSGHTVRAVVIGGLLVAAYAWPGEPGRVRRASGIALAAIVVALVGIARVASGQHWPTDVLGGVLLGGAWLTVGLLLAGALDRRRRRVAPRRSAAHGPEQG